MSKKLFKSALAASLALGAIVAVTPAAEAAGFKDVKGDSETGKAIQNLVDRGIIKGFEDNTFRPNNPVTREQVAIMLAGVLELDTKNGTKTFKDVPKTHPNYGVIAALAEAGIINGYSDGTYQPNKPVTRGEIAILLSRAFNLAPTNEKLPFKDVKAGSDTYKYIAALYSNGITKGDTANTFGVNKPVTRGQLATFIVRAEQSNTSISFDAADFGLEYFMYNETEDGIYKLEESDDATKISLTPVKEGTARLIIDGVAGYENNDDGETEYIYNPQFFLVHVKDVDGKLQLTLEEADMYENIMYQPNSYSFDEEGLELTFTPTNVVIKDAKGKLLDEQFYEIVLNQDELEITVYESGEFQMYLTDDKGNSALRVIETYIYDFVLDFEVSTIYSQHTLNAEDLGFTPVSYEFKTYYNENKKPVANPLEVEIINGEMVLKAVKDGAVYVHVKGKNGEKAVVTAETGKIAGITTLNLEW